jgi:hypothetical protein
VRRARLHTTFGSATGTPGDRSPRVRPAYVVADPSLRGLTGWLARRGHARALALLPVVVSPVVGGTTAITLATGDAAGLAPWLTVALCSTWTAGYAGFTGIKHTVHRRLASRRVVVEDLTGRTRRTVEGAQQSALVACWHAGQGEGLVDADDVRLAVAGDLWSLAALARQRDLLTADLAAIETTADGGDFADLRRVVDEASARIEDVAAALRDTACSAELAARSVDPRRHRLIGRAAAVIETGAAYDFGSATGQVSSTILIRVQALRSLT